MHIVVVSGSHRENSQSFRISQYLITRFLKLYPNITTDLLELTGNPLPLWDETAWQSGSELHKKWAPYAARLQAATGFVFVTPEWSGMVPAGLKNFFLYCAPKDIGHKPGLIVSISGSRGGSYPVNELRTSSYKNTRLCYIPEHIIVHNAASMFLGDEPSSKDDAYLRTRTDYALGVLISYATALVTVRETETTFDSRFAYGM